jgi:hypothetical protein
MHTPGAVPSVRSPTSLGALLLVLLAAALAGPFTSSASASSVNCVPTSLATYCTISEPTVTQPATSYPEVRLYAGQHVRVTDVGGCVQTGGSGKTWKRFLDPISDSPGLYQGTLEIPGTTTGRWPLTAFFGDVTLSVNSTTSLVIGYTDSAGHYGDNGYWGRAGDDGTWDQCKGLGNAYVTVKITN